jgi:predicted alternative tryptophan synthase beta-subunit
VPTQIPNNPGSLSFVISGAVEVAATSNRTKKYHLVYVLNHFLLHQTVIGEESLKQMDTAGEYPDVAVRGGSNFAHCLPAREFKEWTAHPPEERRVGFYFA